MNYYNLGNGGFFKYLIRYFTHITPIQFPKKDDVFLKKNKWYEVKLHFRKLQDGYNVAFVVVKEDTKNFTREP